METACMSSTVFFSFLNNTDLITFLNLAFMRVSLAVYINLSFPFRFTVTVSDFIFNTEVL